jgi:hypothetical protein
MCFTSQTTTASMFCFKHTHFSYQFDNLRLSISFISLTVDVTTESCTRTDAISILQNCGEEQTFQIFYGRIFEIFIYPAVAAAKPPPLGLPVIEIN